MFTGSEGLGGQAPLDLLSHSSVTTMQSMHPTSSRSWKGQIRSSRPKFVIWRLAAAAAVGWAGVVGDGVLNPLAAIQGMVEWAVLAMAVVEEAVLIMAEGAVVPVTAEEALLIMAEGAVLITAEGAVLTRVTAGMWRYYYYYHYYYCCLCAPAQSLHWVNCFYDKTGVLGGVTIKGAGAEAQSEK